MNKKAFSTGGWFAIVIVVLLLAGLGTGNIKVPNFQSAPTVPPSAQVNTAGQTQNVSLPYISTGTSTITLAPVSATQPGVTVATTSLTSINGNGFVAGTNSITGLSPNQVLNILVNSTAQTYHNAVVKNYQVPASPGQSIGVPMNQNATVTEYILQQGSGTSLTNGNNTAGNVNQTGATTGAVITLKDELFGQQLTSTQDIVMLVEMTNGGNMSTSPQGVTMNGNNPFSNAKPAFYTTTYTGSNFYLFNVPALTSSSEVDYSLTFTPISTKAIGSSLMKKNLYTKEWFVDPVTGQLTYDYVDSNGVLKSIATYSYIVQFQG